MELLVTIEREKADQEFLLLHGDGYRRCDQIGAVRSVDEIDFIHVKQLGVDSGNVGRIGLVVVIDKLDLAAQQAAFGVDFFLPNLGAKQRLLAIGRKRTGQRQTKSDLDRIASLRCSGRVHGERGGKNRSADHARDAARCNMLNHDFLPEGFI